MSIQGLSDAEVFKFIRERDRLEILAVTGPSTFTLKPNVSGRLAVQRAILDTEFHFGIGVGALTPDSPRMEP